MNAEAVVVGFQGETGKVGEPVVRGELEVVSKSCLWNLVPKDNGEWFRTPRGGYPPCDLEVFQVGEGIVEVMEETVNRHGGDRSLYVESAQPAFVRGKKGESLFQARGLLSRPLYIERQADG